MKLRKTKDEPSKSADEPLEKPLSIGIPRALLYHRYGKLWETFFRELGYEVVLSKPTDRELFEEGDMLSVDECCLGSKAYLGHVRDLIGKCDMIFVPGFGSADIRGGFCTRYQSLPDMVSSTFRDEDVEFITVMVDSVLDKRAQREAYLGLAKRLGASPRTAVVAYKKALKAYEAQRQSLAKSQEESLKLLSKYKKVAKSDPNKKEQAPIALLLVAHPYIAHDEFIAGDIVRSLEEAGAFVLYADHTDEKRALKRSFEFSETLPWLINRELVGSVLELQDHVDGIVVVSAFPCGPDSLFTDALIRKVEGIPVLNLMIDAQSGSAGVQTRVESFMDILTYKGKGGYLND